MAQCGRHIPGIADAIVFQHTHKAQFLGAICPDELFHTGDGARNYQSRFVKGQDFAERVVTAHGDDARRTLDQRFDIGFERDRFDILQLRAAPSKFQLHFLSHERAVYQQCWIRR